MSGKNFMNSENKLFVSVEAIVIDKVAFLKSYK